MLYLLLVLAVGWLIHKAYHFEGMSHLEQEVVPIYALITFLVNMTWNLQNAVQAMIILILAFFISDYQLKDADLRMGQNRVGRPVVEIKKGQSYVVGWLAVLVLGVLLNISFTQHVNATHLAEDLLQDLKKEIFIFTNFTSKSPWYIWLLTGATTYSYTHRLVKRNKEFLGRQARRQRFEDYKEKRKSSD